MQKGRKQHRKTDTMRANSCRQNRHDHQSLISARTIGKRHILADSSSPSRALRFGRWQKLVKGQVAKKAVFWLHSDRVLIAVVETTQPKDNSSQTVCSECTYALPLATVETKESCNALLSYIQFQLDEFVRSSTLTRDVSRQSPDSCQYCSGGSATSCH